MTGPSSMEMSSKTKKVKKPAAFSVKYKDTYIFDSSTESWEGDITGLKRHAKFLLSFFSFLSFK